MNGRLRSLGRKTSALRVARRAKLDAAAKVFLQRLAVVGRTGQLDAQGIEPHAGAALADVEDPRQAQIHEDGRLCARTQQKQELHGALVPRAGQPDFFRTRQLFVASDALDGVQERLAVQSGNSLRRAAIDGKIRPETQAHGRVAADLFDRPPEPEQLLGGRQDFLLPQPTIPQPGPSQNRQLRDAVIFELARHQAGDTETAAHSRVGSGLRRVHAINLAPEREGLHQPNPPKSLQNAPI